MYGIDLPTTDQDNAEVDADADIEASIEAELSAMKSKEAPHSRQTFTPVSLNIECLFFMKTMDPIQPGLLARKMCEDARDCQDPRQRKCKYINRLTPVFDMDRATESGIVKVARTVLAPWFDLTPEDTDEAHEVKQHCPSTPSPSSIPYTVSAKYQDPIIFSRDVLCR